DNYRSTAKWQELFDHTETWLTRAAPAKAIPVAAQAFALAHLGRFDDADRVVADELAKDPDDRALVFTHSAVAVARGQLADAIKRMDVLTSAKSPESSELNNQSWLKLLEGSDLKGAAAIARRGIQIAPKEPHVANTLAAIEAELGELREARQ